MQASLAQENFSQKFFEQVPEAVSETFTPEQLAALQDVFAEKWARHPVDIRHSFGFWRWRYYFVIIGGHERRDLTRRQEHIFRLTELYLLAAYLGSSIILGLIAIYLTKSALGIDLFPNFHLGIWTWVENNILNQAN
jgi:hypothetical protein